LKVKQPLLNHQGKPMSQQPRLDYHSLAPNAAKALARFSFAAGGALGPRLKELVNLRISQINGCAFCIDMHWAALLKQGMDPRHVNAVAGWREAHRFFSDGERAALNWAEAVNAVPQRVASDADFQEIRRHFNDAQIAELTFAVGAIRSWNMLNASFHTPVPEVPYIAE
jgi:AhpD family alkylhydroperoxidase